MQYRILICDDSDFVRSILASTLEHAGHTVVAQARAGEKAVHLYESHRPDLVFLDIVLPGISGVETLQRIIALDRKARVIMCSAISQRQVIEIAYSLGAIGFTAKPFQPSSILEVIRVATARKLVA